MDVKLIIIIIFLIHSRLASERHPATKTCFKFPWIDNCLMVTKWDNSRNGSGLEVGSVYLVLLGSSRPLARMPDVSYLVCDVGSRMLNGDDDDDED